MKHTRHTIGQDMLIGKIRYQCSGRPEDKDAQEPHKERAAGPMMCQ